MKTRTRTVQRSFLTAFLILIALSAPALAQPAITSLTFTPATINTTGASASVTVNFSATGQGVYYFATAFADPSGNYIGHQVDKSLAPANSVTDSVTITFPPFSPPGTWRIAYVFVLDANNFQYLSTPDAVSAAFPTLGTLQVNSAVDTTPPNLGNLFTFTGSINTTSASADVTVNFTVTDLGDNGGPASGAASVYVGFLSPSGGTNRGTLKTLTPGASVTDTLTITFPKLSEAGTWKISDVIVSDQANNTLVLTADDLVARGFLTDLTVTSANDTTAPTLTSFGFTNPITTSGGPVTVSYAVTDDISGANNVSVTFLSPSGTQQQSGSASFTAANSASGTITLPFPSGTEQGVWTVSFVLLSDAQGNTRFCTGAAVLGCAGFSPYLTVNPPGADTTPPIIIPSVAPLPNGADWNNATPVTVTWMVTDPESGILSSGGTNPQPSPVWCGPTTISAPTTGTAVTCSATSAGGANAVSAVVKIDTSAPVTTNVIATPNPVAIFTDVTISATVTDAGGSNVASAEFNVDGGPFDDLAASDGSFGGSIENVSLTLPASATPLLQTTGIHTICVRGTDFADNVGATECVIFAVYDPNGGFATGGGAIASPAGADLDNPTAAGPATFGFVSKYLPGSTTPSGNLEFHFKDGNLNFKSTAMELLVVTGQPRAQFTGTGTINGTTVCKFDVDAWDGSLQPGNTDGFGLKIRSCDNGHDRYTVSPQPLIRGNIVIHQ